MLGAGALNPNLRIMRGPLRPRFPRPRSPYPPQMMQGRLILGEYDVTFFLSTIYVVCIHSLPTNLGIDIPDNTGCESCPVSSAIHYLDRSGKECGTPCIIKSIYIYIYIYMHIYTPLSLSFLFIGISIHLQGVH